MGPLCALFYENGMNKQQLAEDVVSRYGTRDMHELRERLLIAKHKHHENCQRLDVKAAIATARANQEMSLADELAKEILALSDALDEQDAIEELSVQS